MSDSPLFQNTDEQEQAYAPQQQPDGAPGEHRAEIEEGDNDNSVGEGGAVVLPIAAGMGSGGGTAGTAAAGSGNVAGGMGPAIGAAALSGALDNDDDNVDGRRDR